ncbi:MAG: BTAD domain-containing putative transcriptional regulator [Pseudonocardiaceae bacterium]
MVAEVRVLGPVEALVDGRKVDLRGRRSRQVLAALAVEVGRSVSVERLVDLVWSENPPSSARTQVSIQISALRRAFGEAEAESIETTPDGYRLRADVVRVDAAEAVRALQESREVDNLEDAVGRLRGALGLWRAPPLVGLLTPGLGAVVCGLRELRTTLAEELYGAELVLGHHREVIAELRALVDEEPFQERLREMLMNALWRSGRQVEALEVYRVGRSLLVDQLGIEPDAKLRELHRAILADDRPVDDRPPELRRLERQILAGESPAVGPSATASRLRPAQLPHSPRDFVGRQAELAMLNRLSEATDGSIRVVAVTGTAGVGKTALVNHWAQNARERFPDGQLYVDLHGFSPNDPLPPTVALGAFLRAMGEENAAIPSDPTERAARFRTLTDGLRVLIVLDNASTAEQVRPMLPGGSSCFVVVTSRHALSGLTAGEGAHRLDIGRMTDDDARALLCARVRKASMAHEPVARLIERCARLPLALRVAADRLREPSSRDIAGLVAELEVEQDRLDLLETGDDHTSVRAVLSWSYRQLAPEAARLFRLCGFRCPHTRHYLDVHGAAALLGTADVRLARRLLGELVRCGLLEEAGGGRYQMHELLQAYAAELAEETEASIAAQQRLLGQYLEHGRIGAVSAAAFIRRRESALLSDSASGAGTLELSGRAGGPAVAGFPAAEPALCSGACRRERLPHLHRRPVDHAVAVLRSRRAPGRVRADTYPRAAGGARARRPHGRRHRGPRAGDSPTPAGAIRRGREPAAGSSRTPRRRR